MDASGSQPARGNDGTPLLAHGVKHTQSGSSWLTVPSSSTCNYALGTSLQVVYVEQDGRSDVKSVIPVSLHDRQ
jgi:hypothetical protein